MESLWGELYDDQVACTGVHVKGEMGFSSQIIMISRVCAMHVPLGYIGGWKNDPCSFLSSTAAALLLRVHPSLSSPLPFQDAVLLLLLTGAVLFRIYGSRIRYDSRDLCSTSTSSLFSHTSPLAHSAEKNALLNAALDQ